MIEENKVFKIEFTEDYKDIILNEVSDNNIYISHGKIYSVIIEESENNFNDELKTMLNDSYIWIKLLTYLKDDVFYNYNSIRSVIEPHRVIKLLSSYDNVRGFTVIKQDGAIKVNMYVKLET